MTVSIYLYTDIKGPRRKDGTAMYVLEAVKDDKTATITGMIHTEQTTAMEAELRALRAAAERFKKTCPTVIFTTCGGILGAYKNGWIRKWKKDGWKNTKGETVASAEDWEVIDRMLGEEIEVHLGEKHSYLSWMESEVSRWNMQKQ